MPNGLGRGLQSLIPNKNNPPAVNPAVSQTGAGEPALNRPAADEKSGQALQVDIKEIKVNPLQPRRQFTDVNLDELVESIKKHGVIQPLIVSRSGDRYELIAGERRLRASEKAGLDKVPVIIRDVNDQQKLEVALIENIQREDLNPIDLAVAYEKLVSEFNLTQEDVAKQVGKSRSAVTNTLRLLNLPEEIRLALIDGKISEGHAKYLTGLDSETKQMNLFRKIMHNDLTVGDTGKEARRMGGTKQARIKINYADKDKEFALRQFFGAKTEIKRKGRGGQIIIDFYSDEELGEIIGKVR